MAKGSFDIDKFIKIIMFINAFGIISKKPKNGRIKAIILKINNKL